MRRAAAGRRMVGGRVLLRGQKQHRSVNVGVVGAGNMGRGCAASLARAGYDVVQYDMDVKNLRASVEQAPDRIRAAGSVVECCEGVAVAVTVSNEEAERAVFLKEGLLREAGKRGSLVLNLGTCSVSWARELHRAAEEAGVEFLEAPVSGGPEGALNGQLTLMLGGRRETFEKAEKILVALGKKWRLLGGPGAGAAAKLVNQALVAANAHAAAECLALAKALGCETKTIGEILDGAWGQSAMFDRAVQTLLQAEDDEDRLFIESSKAPLRNFVKDVGLIQAAASDAGVSTSCLRPARKALELFAERGQLHCDWASIAAVSKRGIPYPTHVNDLHVPPEIDSETASLYESEIERLSRRNGVVPVVDDDPTGTQTVHNVSVLSWPWRDQDLDAEFGVSPKDDNTPPCFYVLANTRALDEQRASERAKEIGLKLRSRNLKCVVSRSDSTLRGHFPAETDALASGLGWTKTLVVVAPFFFEGGRISANDVHFIRDASGTLTPCSDTEFAKDAAFGYSESNLREWVKEKTGTPATASVSLAALRGPDAPSKVARILLDAAASQTKNPVVVCNAMNQADASALALGILHAQEQLEHNQGILLRCAASLVAARCHVSPKPLTNVDLFPSMEEDQSPKKGLVVVGSYVGKTTTQLAKLLDRYRDRAAVVEIDASECAASDDRADREIQRAVDAVDHAFSSSSSSSSHNKVVVLHTSRAVVRSRDAADQHSSSLSIGGRVNDAVCDVVRRALRLPSAQGAFVLAKGGITSNDVAVRSIGVRKATVLGQVLPGVPAWRLGPETALPGAPYVVFPGNVGTDDGLADAVDILAGQAPISFSEEREEKKQFQRPVAFSDSEKTSAADVLADARERGRAVGAFNLYNLEGLVAARQAVDATGLPAIVQFHPAAFDFGHTGLLSACMDFANRPGPRILVALDHASDTAAIQLALDRGVHYVMADGSRLEYESNVQWTADVVRLAASRASVEAELGLLAGQEDGLDVDAKEAKMTDPDVVADFIASTKVNALAVTIGNVHGPYATPNPDLDWRRLDAIRSNAPPGLPLVLHGASGLPLPVIHRAIKAGVCKFNVNTEVRAASKDALRTATHDRGNDVLDIMRHNVDAMAAVIKAKITAFAPPRS